jgi:hypothetical protein
MLLAKFVEFVAVGDSLGVRGLQGPWPGRLLDRGRIGGRRELGREMIYIIVGA